MEAKRGVRLISALIWLAVMALAACYLALTLPQKQLSSNILELLPSEGEAQISSSYADTQKDRLIFLIKSDEKQAEDFFTRLSKEKFFSQVRGKVPQAEQDEFSRFWFQYRLAFVPESVIKLMKTGDRYVRSIQSMLYSPYGAPRADEMKRDPLLLARRSAVGNAGDLPSFHDGWIVIRHEGVEYRLVSAELKSPLSYDELSDAVKTLTSLCQASEAANPGMRVLMTGIPLFSALAADSTRKDIAFLGSISVAALIVFLFIAFRSLKPLFLCLISVACGVAGGLSVSLLVFSELHAVTLVMCLSLIGIATDYTTYYAAARMRAPVGESAWNTLAQLRPSLLHALLTTSITYGCILISPLPVLRQLAVFAVCGLICSCITVFVWQPFFLQNFRGRPSFVETITAKYFGLFEKSSKTALILLAVLIVFCAVGLYQVKADDSLTNLQSLNTELLKTQKEVEKISGQDFSSQRLLVKAKDDEALLVQLEKLRAQTANESGAAELRSMLPPLNSVSRQNETEALAQALYPKLEAFYQEVGLKGVEKPHYEKLTLKGFLSSAVGSGYKDLYLRKDGYSYFVLPMPKDKAFEEKLKELNIDYSKFDRRKDMETVLQVYREDLLYILLFTFALIVLTFAFKFGLAAVLGAGVSLMLSAAAGIAALGFANMSLNIFSLLALILILGIGIDYQVFFRQLSAYRKESYFALFVAAVSTILSLGILVFCSTSAVSNFGLVLSVGVLTAFLTAPIGRNK